MTDTGWSWWPPSSETPALSRTDVRAASSIEERRIAPVAERRNEHAGLTADSLGTVCSLVWVEVDRDVVEESFDLGPF